VDRQTYYASLDNIPMSALDRVEVLNDGASSIYGSDAIGGVVNIITRSGGNKFHGDLFEFLRNRAFNAANEVAVAAFLAGRLPFLGIAATVEETLAEIDGAAARDLDELMEADATARRLAERGLPVA